MTATTKKARQRKPYRSFGAIRQLPSGKFQASYLVDGTRHAQTFPKGTPKRDVERYLSTIETDLNRGKWADPKAGGVKFGIYAEEWLSAGVRREKIRPTTEDKYRGLLNRHLLPAFGTLPLQKITDAKVRAWHDDMMAKRIPSTTAGAYRLLATIFNTAVKVDKLLPSTPCTIEGAGRENAAERHTATVSECQAAIDAIPEQYRCAVFLAAWGALRRSEVLALQRGDIDLASGTVRISRAWTKTEAGRKNLGEPKTEAGKRTLHLPQQICTVLEAHLSAHVAPVAGAWLFPGPNDLPMNVRTFVRIWERARTAIGRTDLTFHDLRHTGLTWVSQLGFSDKEFMRRAGHKSYAAAIRYQHAGDHRDKALADKLGDMFESESAR